MSLEIHTITFSGDSRLFELQAISIDRKMDHGEISKYRIVINDKNEDQLLQSLENFIANNISLSLRQKIEIVSSTKYLELGSDGWKDQQYLKLFSVADSSADWAIVLDAKNHFIKDTLVSDFFVGEKAKTTFAHPSPLLEPLLLGSNEFFGVDNYPGSSMPTITPYTMKPELVRLMLGRIKSDARLAGVGSLSTAPALKKVSEFFLYYAFLQKLGCVDEYYQAAGRLCETLYTTWPQDHAIVERFLNDLLAGKYFVFGLHRKRLPQLTDIERALISEIWAPLRLPNPHSYYLEAI
ncbi:hypothetical protein IYR97_13480 [Pseudomonas fulva]|uniref:Uncharacterized protein n=1 Tax=Pseudomonas fulva TaxID=47880 RepID=A0A7S9L4J8_9PSED|nr:DUF6492 family protein [Pseudomonas fulva]QPH42345.1 hypothetical protein IYR97_13480 [Pseudomonas fulva]QPH47409.1 hypothetical protein IZU98_13375 [Pseudomonas fulva]